MRDYLVAVLLFGAAHLLFSGLNVIAELESQEEKNFIATSGDETSSNKILNSAAAATVVPPIITHKNNIGFQNLIRAVKEENLNASRRSEHEKIFSHFFMHIPKTGVSYAWAAINRLSYEQQEWLDMNETDRYRACNMGTYQPYKFQSRYAKSFSNTRCAMWVSESEYTLDANHVYTIFRNPKTHTVSQFFHCKESHDHTRHRRNIENTTLDTWLSTWVDRMMNTNDTDALRKTKEFRCYHPINAQSRLAWFLPQAEEDKYAYYNSTAIRESDGGEIKPEIKTKLKQDILNKFAAVGDQKQMVKCICNIYIRYTGFVPEKCDCSSSEPQQQQSGKIYDHGVKHHGDSYGVTSEQERLISLLTEKDQILYDLVLEIFEEQVKEIEDEFGIQICNNRKLV